MTFIKHIFYSVCAGALFLVGACTQHPHQTTRIPPVNFSSNLPEVAAEYVSTTKSAHASSAQSSSQQSWRIWRQPQRLQRDNLNTPISDLWQRDGNHFTLKKYFHAEQRGVEFHDDDLRMLNLTPDWPSTQGLLDVSVLEKLKLIKSSWQDAIPLQDYQGEIDGVHWRIEVRTDLMLPTRIEHKSKNHQQSIRLIAAYPLPQAPWQPTTIANHQLIDFADFGDMENDPFVKRVEGLLGIGH